MDEKHRVILSMYYRNPDNNPKKIPDWFCSMGMDITQLLLLTEGVYKESAYKYNKINKGLGISPIEKKRCEYEALVCTDNTDLNNAQIIDILPILEHDEEFIDACLHTDIPLKIRARNYRLNLLVNNINGTHFVSDRDSVEEFCLFSDQGKVFIGYLYYLLGSIVNFGIKNENYTPEQLIEFINNDYYSIRTVFSKHDRILNEIQTRSMSIKNFDVTDDLKIELDIWIEEKRNVPNAILFKFLFHNAISSLIEAATLVKHIVDILNTLSKGEGNIVMWKHEIINLPIRRCPAIFDGLNSLKSELCSNYHIQCFQKDNWTTQYLRELSFIYNNRHI